MVAIPFRSRVRDPLMELWDDPAISAALGTSLAISAAGFGTCKGVDLSLQGGPWTDCDKRSSGVPMKGGK